ncbi:MAG TPA: HPF/RaiA family ribosome-associated protein [Gemmatimonadales bacterium]
MSPGRRNAASIPLHVRASGLRLAPSERLYIRRKLGSKLSKFASSVERASVRLEDVNGPRGGVDHVCRIKVVLRALPSVVYEKRGAVLRAVIDGALDGVERAVRRSVQRRRMAPVRARSRGLSSRTPAARRR